MPVEEWTHWVSNGTMPTIHYSVAAIVDERKSPVGTASEFIVKFKASCCVVLVLLQTSAPPGASCTM